MYTKAYTAIIDYLLAFGVGRCSHGQDFGSKYIHTTASVGFSAEYEGGVMVGDLVRLGSMCTPEYRIGWLEETRELSPGNPEYLIRSAKTGNLCWWGNVGISYFHRPTLKDFPSWRWTDDQFAFESLFNLACSKDDPYIYLPYIDEFLGDHVRVGMRIRFGLSDDREFVLIENWKKFVDKKRGFTRIKLLEAYREMVRQQKLKTPTRGATP